MEEIFVTHLFRIFCGCCSVLGRLRRLLRPVGARLRLAINSAWTGRWNRRRLLLPGLAAPAAWLLFNMITFSLRIVLALRICLDLLSRPSGFLLIACDCCCLNERGLRGGFWRAFGFALLLAPLAAWLPPLRFPFWRPCLRFNFMMSSAIKIIIIHAIDTFK